MRILVLLLFIAALFSADAPTEREKQDALETITSYKSALQEQIKSSKSYSEATHKVQADKAKAEKLLDAIVKMGLQPISNKGTDKAQSAEIDKINNFMSMAWNKLQEHNIGALGPAFVQADYKKITPEAKKIIAGEVAGLVLSPDVGKDIDTLYAKYKLGKTTP